MKHDKKGGASFLSTLKSVANKGSKVASSASKALSPVVREIASDVAPAVVDMGAQALKNYAVGQGIRTRKMGKGPVSDVLSMFGLGVRLTQRQIGTLKRGGAITINPKMVSDTADTILQLLPQQAKRVVNSLGKDKGVRVALKAGEDLISKTMGGSLLDTAKSIAVPVAKAIAPLVIDAGAKAIKKRVGKGSAYNSPAYQQVMDLDGMEGGALFSMPQGVQDALIDAGSKALIKHYMGSGIRGVRQSTLNDLDMPTQLGSPYQHIGSPAMNPFIPTHSQLSGYNPLPHTTGGALSMGQGINPPGAYGEGIYPPGYRAGMGTKKGMMRRTARRAYEGGKVDFGKIANTAASLAPLLMML